MAINGIDIKNLKINKGHGGRLLLQGVIYKDRHKLGTWVQGSLNGDAVFSFEESVLQDRVNKWRECIHGKSDLDLTVELFLYDIASLKDLERDYKKKLKKDYKFFTVFTLLGEGLSTGFYSIEMPSEVESNKHKDAFIKEYVGSSKLKSKDIQVNTFSGGHLDLFL